MNDEMKRLVDDAAKLLGLTPITLLMSGAVLCSDGSSVGVKFNPLDPERGDLMRVAMAAELVISFSLGRVIPNNYRIPEESFTKGDHDSLAIAVLRAASAVLKARGDA